MIVDLTDIISAIQTLASAVAPFGPNQLSEIWLERHAFEVIADGAMRNGLREPYVYGLLYVNLPEGRVRIRSAT